MKRPVVTMPAIRMNAFGTLPEAGISEPEIVVDFDDEPVTEVSRRTIPEEPPTRLDLNFDDLEPPTRPGCSIAAVLRAQREARS